MSDPNKGIKLKHLKWSEILDIIRRDIRLEGYVQQDLTVKTMASVFLAAVSLLLTIMNIYKGYTFMALMTAVLALGFVVSAVVVGKYKNRPVAMVIIAVQVMIIFSYFAISGQNEGFAILWILLVPAVASYMLNVRIGLILSFYFQLLLCFMFYTPLREYFAEYYTETFMTRFPVLYFAAFLISFAIVMQKEVYATRIEDMAYKDGLTGLSNRRSMEIETKRLMKARAEGFNDDLTAIVFDVNGLKELNDRIGHEAGDEIIIGAAECIRKSFTDCLVAARTGGDEFAVISSADEAAMQIQLEMFDKNVRNWKGVKAQNLSVSLGMASSRQYPNCTVKQLIKLADQAMYINKAFFYSQSGNNRRQK